MATLRQYFDTDFSRLLKATRTFSYRGVPLELDVSVALHYDFEANAKFLSCYLPRSGNGLWVCRAILAVLDELLAIGNGVEVNGGGFVGETPMSCKTLQFCGRVFLYCEDEIAKPDIESLLAEAKTNGLFLQIRDTQFSAARSHLERPLAFISHDSRDKDEIARPIAIELSKLLCPVWYDEFSLKVGASLRESIENGLRECKKCILVLSKNFLSNSGWTKTEFTAVFTRELLEQTNLVLPIWCGIDKTDVYNYSPTLLDRVGVKWELGVEEVVRQVHLALI